MAAAQGTSGWDARRGLTRRFWRETRWLVGAAGLVGVLACMAASAAAISFQEEIVDANPPNNPWMKAVGDLDGDGRLDLIVVGMNGPAVWYQNPSWQKHTISSSTGSSGSSTDVTTGDLNNDGFPDVVLANGIWFENPLPGGNPTSTPWARHDIDGVVGHDVVVRDLDRDGDLDVVKRHQGQAGDIIRVFRNDGNDLWSAREIPSHAGEGLDLGDLDGDGDADIAIARYWYENDGDVVGGAWRERAYTDSYTHSKTVVRVARVSGDSLPDIVLAPAEPRGGAYRIAWFEQGSDPTALWSEHVIENGVETVLHSLVVADVSDDGHSDVVVAAMEQGDDPDLVRAFLNDGAESFTSATIASGGSHNLQGGDLDGDGDFDLFGANWRSNTSVGAPVRLWWNLSQVPTPGLDKGQQACVNAMNRSGQKVNGVQIKENEACLNDHQKGKLAPLTLEACTNSDRKGKVQKAQDRTVTGEGKKCDPLPAPPPFAYTDATTVNDAAVAGPLDMIHAIFGDPIDDTDLYANALDKDSARCQKEMLKRVNQLEDAVLKEINKAKKKAIKELLVNSAEALEAALTLVLSSNDTIWRKEDQLLQKVDSQCSALIDLPSTVFPGVCADDSLAEIQDCLIGAARCVACSKINAFDALALDCDQEDNQNADGSCPLP